MLQHVATAKSVVPLRGYGTAVSAAGVPFFYITMPRCEGSLATWRERLPREAAGQLRLYLRVFREVVEAVRDVHAHGIVHFDIKPHNVLVTARDGKAAVGKLSSEVGPGGGGGG